MGSFICLDDKTASGQNLGRARLRIRDPLDVILPEPVVVNIDGKLVSLLVREEYPIQLFISGTSLSQSSGTASDSEAYSRGFVSESDDIIEQFPIDGGRAGSDNGGILADF